MNKRQKFADYSFCYIAAWWMILLSPIWLPFWLAKKIYAFGLKESHEHKD